MINLIIWLITGAIAGFLASKVMGNSGNQSIVGDIIVGIIGSFVGGTLYSLLVRGTADITSSLNGFNLSSIIISTLGAIVFLGILKLFRGNTRTV